MRKYETPKMQALLSVAVIVLLLLSATSVFFLTLPQAEEVAAPSDGSESLPASQYGSAAEESAASAASARVRRDGVQNFLLCGKDRASGLYDVIIVARLDAKARSLSLVQIPRDTYASYTERSYRKLNGAGSVLGGVKGLASFLSANLGIPIDHYALVDLDCVGDVVDAVGGVTLDIPVDMDYEDRAQNLSIHLKAGKQTLCGDEAEQFLRFRSGYVTADLGRLDAQKLFLSAFMDTVREHTTLPDLIRIVRTLYGRVETDLSLGETVRLAAIGKKLTSESLTMTTLPGEAVRTQETSGAWYYVLNRAASYEIVNRMLNVCETDLPLSSFDPLERFTDIAIPHFDAVYRSAAKANAAFGGGEIGTHYESIPRIGG